MKTKTLILTIALVAVASLLACAALPAAQATPVAGALMLAGFALAVAKPTLLALSRIALFNTATIGVEMLQGYSSDVRTAEVDLPYKCLLVYKGTASTTNGCILNVATTPPLGVTDESTYVAGDRATILRLGNDELRKLRANGAIAVGGQVYCDAAGTVQAQPTTAGEWWYIGIADTAALAAGDYFVARTVEPIRVVAIAAGTTIAQLITAITAKPALLLGVA